MKAERPLAARSASFAIVMLAKSVRRRPIAKAGAFMPSTASQTKRRLVTSSQGSAKRCAPLSAAMAQLKVASWRLTKAAGIESGP